MGVKSHLFFIPARTWGGASFFKINKQKRGKRKSIGKVKCSDGNLYAILRQLGPAVHIRHIHPRSMPRDQLPSGGEHLDFLLLNIFITPFVSGPPGPSLWPSTEMDPLLSLHRREGTVCLPLPRA